MLEVAVDSDLAQFWLCLSFYGSPLPLATLRDRGLEGNAAGWYLYQYDPPGRDESATPLLPQNIPVDELFSTSTEAQRLEGELREADRALFRHLFESVKDEDWKTSDV